MHIERASDLPKDTAEAVDAKGNVIARFTPNSGRALVGTAVLRFSSAAFDRLAAALEAIERRQRASS